MRKFILAAMLAASVPAYADDLAMSGAFLRASPKVTNAGAGFVTITNNGQAADRLIGAEAGVSKVVELHTHIREGDVMRMRPVESITVPAGGKAELKPGGDHVMFINLHQPLKEGDKVPVTLIFEKAGRRVVEMPVTGPGAMAPAPAHTH